MKNQKRPRLAVYIEFLLTALLIALREAAGTDQGTDQVTDQVAVLLRVLDQETLTAFECMKRLKSPTGPPSAPTTSTRSSPPI